MKPVSVPAAPAEAAGRTAAAELELQPLPAAAAARQSESRPGSQPDLLSLASSDTFATCPTHPFPSEGDLTQPPTAGDGDSMASRRARHAEVSTHRSLARGAHPSAAPDLQRSVLAGHQHVELVPPPRPTRRG